MIYNLAEHPGKKMSGTATAPILAEKFVSAAIMTCTSAEGVLGISQYDATATGEPITIGVDGILRVLSGAALSVGSYVQSDNEGRAITRIGTNNPVGLAITAALTKDEVVLIKIPV